MVSRRRRFNREFKIETVKLVTDSDNSVTQIAADMGIHPNTLYKWVQAIFRQASGSISRHRAS